MSQDELVYAAKATIAGKISTDNGNFSTDGTSGNVTAAALTASGNVLLSNKKLGAAVAGDMLDLSAATGKIGVGPTSTKLQFQLAATTNNLQDNQANELPSCARSTFSTITATNHNYAGSTPNTCLLNQQTGTATATAIGTIGATQYTPTGGVSATYAVLTYNA